MRLNEDGSLDSSFNIVSLFSSNSLSEVLILADGKILIGGSFQTVDGGDRAAIARLNTDATLDTTFAAPFFSSGISTITIRPNGKILVGGILRINGFAAESKAIVQLNENGTLHNAVNPNITSSVSSIESLADGRIIIGGRMNVPGNLPLDEAFDISVARLMRQMIRGD